MEGEPSTEKIEFFLRNVFDYLDRYTEFTERPMADERHWLGVNAPIVQLIFLDDVAHKRPIAANYVTLFVTGMVFTLEQYVDACVKVLQSLREEDLPDVVIEYVNMLVNVYAKANAVKTMLPESQVDIDTGGQEEEIMEPALDQSPAAEALSALVEEEEPVSETPVEEETAPAPSPGSEEPRGWK